MSLRLARRGHSRPMVVPLTPPVTSGLVQLLDFDSITGTDGAALASTIPDASGNGKTMAAISGKAPTVKQAFVNGHTALQFSGAQGIVGVRAVSDDFTILQVFKSSTYGTSNQFYGNGRCLYTCEAPGVKNDFGTAVGVNNFLCGVGNIHFIRDDIASVTTPNLNLTSWHVAVMDRLKSTGLMRTFIDPTTNTPLASLSGETDSLTDSANAAIGCVPAGSEGFFTGYYACLVVYNRVLTDAERNSVCSWLKTRYGTL